MSVIPKMSNYSTLQKAEPTALWFTRVHLTFDIKMSHSKPKRGIDPEDRQFAELNATASCLVSSTVSSGKKAISQNG